MRTEREQDQQHARAADDSIVWPEHPSAPPYDRVSDGDLHSAEKSTQLARDPASDRVQMRPALIVSAAVPVQVWSPYAVGPERTLSGDPGIQLPNAELAAAGRAARQSCIPSIRFERCVVRFRRTVYASTMATMFATQYVRVVIHMVMIARSMRALILRSICFDLERVGSARRRVARSTGQYELHAQEDIRCYRGKDREQPCSMSSAGFMALYDVTYRRTSSARRH